MGTRLLRDVYRMRPASVSDVGRSANIPVWHAPGLSVDVQINNPDDVVIAMPGFKQIGYPFPDRPAPPRTTHNNPNERRIELKHAQREANAVP